MSEPWQVERFRIAGISNRAPRWKLRTQTVEFGPLPVWMGIVNVTPDSFSDGGQFHNVDDAIAQALQLVDDGADILDIGGESTRPCSDSVAEDEELARVIPVIEALAGRAAVPISIDTSKASVAEAAIAAGAEIINDVTGLEGDPRMAVVAAETGAGVCAMHMQGTPATMQDNPTYSDVVGEILQYLAARRDALRQLGIDAQKICLDPGIGFGKTHGHNYELMNECQQFHSLGQPILVGHSRKGFLAKLLAHSDRDRTAATAGSAVALARQGVQVIRVHDVRSCREATLAFAACGGLS